MDDEIAERRTGIAVGVALVLVVLAYAWWAVGLPSFSSSATVAVLAAGSVATALGALSRRRRRQADDVAVARWAVLVLALGAWQLAAFLQQPRDDHPTISSLTNALLDTHPARAIAFALWLAAARELARR